MLTLCPTLLVLWSGCFWPSLTALTEFCVDTERTCFLLKQNRRHAAVCKPAQGEGSAWAPVCRVQPSAERLRTSFFQCSTGLAGSPRSQPETVPRRARSSRSMALAFSDGFGAGEAKPLVRAPSSSVAWCWRSERIGAGWETGHRGVRVPEQGWQPP